jgi:hypothetical protein
MRYFLSILLFALLAACSNESKNSTENNKEKITLKANRVEIYAFHGTRQCETCKHMKAYTKSTLDKHFKKELKSGEIVYQVIDVDDEKNYELAEKFEATGTALMVNRVNAGKDQIEDWSDFAFEYANGDQTDYEAQLKKMIQGKLK